MENKDDGATVRRRDTSGALGILKVDSTFMKYLQLLLVLPGVVCASDFVTGQAARLIIGQPNFTAADTGTPSSYQLGAVGGLAYANNTLFVVDGNRVQASPVLNRVLIFDNISSFVTDPAADIPQGVRCPVCAGTLLYSSNGTSSPLKGADMVVGQPDFISSGTGQTSSSFRTPTAVATDGKVLAVADTDNNRVLIWKSMPASIGQPADIVLGQKDFTTIAPVVTDNRSFRGPQGLWIQGTHLFVADTQNHRVMVWNNIPTSNFQPADFVLGQPNFNASPNLNIAVSTETPTAKSMLNPVSVTSDGTHLFVTDLGNHRVLIWNSIPTTTDVPADVEIGQKDMVTANENDSPSLCASNGTDSTTNQPTYPARCAATLSFPRYALSDGTRLYVADGGNDRILVYEQIPSGNSARADIILGQQDEFSDVVTDSTDTFRPDANITRSSPDTIRTPLSLAWDGANLYASDPYDRRVLVYTPGDIQIPVTAVANAFSRAVFAIGTVDLSGTITAKDTITITIAGTNYTYTVQSSDTLTDIVNGLVAAINKNGGDPNVFAIANPGFNEVVLSAKMGGVNGNNITLAVSASTGATETATASSSTLTRGNTAAEIAPGTLVTFFGNNLSDSTATGTPDANGEYPTTLGGVTVYFDGIKGPLLFVSPTQINTQVPFDVQDASGVSSYVVSKARDGFTSVTEAINVPIVLQNPGILAGEGQDPRPALAFHASSYSIAVVDVGGTVTSGDTVTVTINGNNYTYTVTSGDTLASIRDAVIGLINADANSPVGASAAGQYTRIILTAKVPGPDGNGITVAASSSTNATEVLTALQSSTCCANAAGSPITLDNPAVPGEVISIYATGVGL
ncbi:MAG: hypothetical protein JOZ62_15780, partial [Acidobacteriaceae bacterium]|nr:hypothetical protein [Acidobacteriaceae bacterium]